MESLRSYVEIIPLTWQSLNWKREIRTFLWRVRKLCAINSASIHSIADGYKLSLGKDELVSERETKREREREKEREEKKDRLIDR